VFSLTRRDGSGAPAEHSGADIESLTREVVAIREVVVVVADAVGALDRPLLEIRAHGGVWVPAASEVFAVSARTPVRSPVRARSSVALRGLIAGPDELVTSTRLVSTVRERHAARAHVAVVVDRVGATQVRSHGYGRRVSEGNLVPFAVTNHDGLVAARAAARVGAVSEAVTVVVHAVAARRVALLWRECAAGGVEEEAGEVGAVAEAVAIVVRVVLALRSDHRRPLRLHGACRRLAIAHHDAVPLAAIVRAVRHAVAVVVHAVAARSVGHLAKADVETNRGFHAVVEAREILAIDEAVAVVVDAIRARHVAALDRTRFAERRAVPVVTVDEAIAVVAAAVRAGLHGVFRRHRLAGKNARVAGAREVARLATVLETVAVVVAAVVAKLERVFAIRRRALGGAGVGAAAIHRAGVGSRAGVGGASVVVTAAGEREREAERARKDVETLHLQLLRNPGQHTSRAEAKPWW